MTFELNLSVNFTWPIKDIPAFRVVHYIHRRVTRQQALMTASNQHSLAGQSAKSSPVFRKVRRMTNWPLGRVRSWVKVTWTAYGQVRTASRTSHLSVLPALWLKTVDETTPMGWSGEFTIAWTDKSFNGSDHEEAESSTWDGYNETILQADESIARIASHQWQYDYIVLVALVAVHGGYGYDWATCWRALFTVWWQTVVALKSLLFKENRLI
jgi:hypothetical protein